MATVKMNSVQSVEIDGVDIGSLAAADKLLTFEEIQQAVVEWHDRERAATQQVFSDSLKQTIDEFTRHSQATEIANAEAIRQREQKIAECLAEIEGLKQDGQSKADEIAVLRQAVANLMLGTTDGREAMREFKRMTLRASINVQQAELAQLGG